VNNEVNRQFVDALRECLGKGPLYRPNPPTTDEERFYQPPNRMVTDGRAPRVSVD
jgi:hypothetical protein